MSRPLYGGRHALSYVTQQGVQFCKTAKSYASNRGSVCDCLPAKLNSYFDFFLFHESHIFLCAWGWLVQMFEVYLHIWIHFYYLWKTLLQEYVGTVESCICVIYSDRIDGTDENKRFSCKSTKAFLALDKGHPFVAFFCMITLFLDCFSKSGDIDLK